MITTKSNKSSRCPETLQIKIKAMTIIKIVFKDDYFSNLPIYNNKNIIVLETNRNIMKEGWKCKLKLGFLDTNACWNVNGLNQA